MNKTPSCEVWHGDCLDVLRKLPDNKIDACVTDPPYGLSSDPDIVEVLSHWIKGEHYEHSDRGGFMGKRWDSFVPGPDYWREVFRVLKPGAHALVFAGTRTQDLMTIALRFAGFEIRDVADWLYGSGFPKSLDVSKAIDKRRDDTDDVRVICRALRASMDAYGLTSSDLAPMFDCHPRLIDHWAARDTDSQPNLPTWEQWLRLKHILAMGDGLDAEVWRLNGRKGTLGPGWEQRAITGEYSVTAPGANMRTGIGGGMGEDRKQERRDEPATEAAATWKGYGTALKPAREPIIVARKPLEGKLTIAENVTKWGTGALNIDGCRIGTSKDVPASTSKSSQWFGTGHETGHETGHDPNVGRWPANLLLDEEAAAMLDEQTATLHSAGFAQGPQAKWQGDAESSNGVTGWKGSSNVGLRHGDSGGASRFFYCAKTSRRERDLGCESLPPKSGGEATDRVDGTDGLKSPRAGAGRGGGVRNHHPTVKPVALMRYLVRLATPPTSDPIVLDPFAGSGGTGIAAFLEGVHFLGIERESEYVEIARLRIAAAETIREDTDP